MTDHTHLDAYIEHAARLFDQAVDRVGGGPDCTVTVGGHPARFRFAGSAMADTIMPAMRHLVAADRPEGATDDGAATGGGIELTVLAWDEASTGVALPPPQWDLIDSRDRANARVFGDERFSLCYERRLDLFSAIDLHRGVAVAWTHDAATLPSDFQGTPLERLLQGWLRSKGLLVVHAGAVGVPGAGLLLAGRSGSGKSTTSVRAISAGLLYVGDDCALVEGGPAPKIHALYNSARLRRDALETLLAMHDQVVNPQRSRADKALVFLDSFAPQQLATELPLRAIALPRVGGQTDTVVTPAAPSEVYRAIAPDTALTMLGGDAQAVLALIRGLVSELPCYHLTLGSDGDGVTDALRGLLDGAAQ